MAALTVLFLLLSVLSLSNARPNGAPAGACASLTPAPGPHGAGQTTAIPYSLSFQPPLESFGGYYFYTAGITYNVTLRGMAGRQFQGFLVQLRSQSQTIVGNQLMATGSDIQQHMCTPSTGGFTHTSMSNKDYITFQWRPTARSGNLIFRFTVVQTQQMHWDGATTDVLREKQYVCINSTNVGPASISWMARDTNATFIIQTISVDGYYVALGFSNDRLMTNSDIIVGAVGQNNSFVDDRWVGSTRSMPTIDPQQDISMSSAVLLNGSITVTFTRPLAISERGRDIALTSDGTNCVYFLIARGTSNVADRTIARHAATNRFVSMERVCLCGGAGVVASLSVWLLLLIAATQYLL